MRNRSIEINFNNTKNQLQSPLFDKLPLDVRRHIYLQYWLDYGTVQHIYLFGPGSYLSHYPCVLEADAFNHHHPPLPKQPASEPEPATESEGDDNDQPESYDDPGDINGAIAQIVANPPQTQPAAATFATLNAESNTNPWVNSPWCMHKRCFQEYMEAYHMYFERAYSRNYTRGTNLPAHATVGLTRPFFLCKRIYTEASESMYSVLRFSFASVGVLGRMMKDVPAYLSRRIQVVDLISTVPVAHLPPVPMSYSSLGSEFDMSLLSSLCQTLPDLLPNIRELCLTLHIDADRNSETHRRALPEKDWFGPLYTVAGELKNLQIFDVKLVSRFEQKEGSFAYGKTPKHLADAPFKAVLVPMGWHAAADCIGFRLD